MGARKKISAEKRKEAQKTQNTEPHTRFLFHTAPCKVLNRYCSATRRQLISRTS